MRCLEKHPSDRWQTADDLHDALEPYAMTSGATAPSQAVARKSFAWTPQRIAVAAGIAGLAVTGLIVSNLAFRNDRPSLVVGNTRQLTNDQGLEVHPAVSPDGRMIAYSTGPWNKSRIFVRQLPGGRAIALTDTTGIAVLPRWSPDGSQILYTTPFGSRIIPALGGAPATISALDDLASCAWSRSGDRMACMSLRSGALVVAGQQGENPRTIAGTRDVIVPAWSSDDKLIAFTSGNLPFHLGENIGNVAASSLWVVAADDGEPVRLTDDTHLNTSPAWTADGSILFVSSRGGTRDIYLQRLNGNLSPRGDPVRLTTGLDAHTISVDRSATTLAYSVFRQDANIWSTPIPSAPVESPLLTQVTYGNQTVESGYVSPDGKWLAYDSNINGNQDIFRIPIDGGEPQQLTRNMGDSFNPQWSHDSREIVFHSMGKGTRDVYVMDATGENLHNVVASPRHELLGSFDHAGTTIWFQGSMTLDSLHVVRRDPRDRRKWDAPRFHSRASFIEASLDGLKLLMGMPDGIVVSNSDGSGARNIVLGDIMTKIAAFGQPFWSPDSRHAYVSIREKDGTSSIWELNYGGNSERRLVWLKDPGRQFFRTSISPGNGRFYFTIGDRKSDIWTMELEKQ
jgi:Tol biopolymer transport system component